MDLKLTLAKKKTSGKQLSTIIYIQAHTYTPRHAMPISTEHFIKCSPQLYEEDNVINFILETAKLRNREAKETTLQRLQAVKPTLAQVT